MKRLMCLGLALLASLCAAQESEELMSYAPRAQAPRGYPASYAATVRAAEDEGRLVVYATTDTAVARPLIDDFKSMYPRINIEYEDLTSTELHYRFVAETQLGGGSADVVWSSSMDLQSFLVSNGYAQTYESPESAGLPAWAKWKGQAWATTFEPIAIAYNKALLPAAEVPRTHADLAKMLNGSAERFKGKVMSYDIEKSGLGFFLATQDVGVAPVFWDIAQGFGKVDVRFASTTDAMLKQVASGKTTIAYNVLGSYAVAQARKDPNIGYVFPSDYTLVMSRLQLINKKAAHPNAARLWVDYILSQRGQTVIANQAGLYSVRADVNGETTAARLTQTLGNSLRAIAVGPSLIGYLNNQNYRDFIVQWRKATENAAVNSR
ncbi:ABC transporter substrate-binding protein [Variovorax rhizosphaerae]|uniref:ABC transporter substrate-binding protein n=1 Tax=Variovorax rhizosphaerae TaxID=1836200 RepID=A0ABU8WP01_9BURK